MSSARLSPAPLHRWLRTHKLCKNLHWKEPFQLVNQIMLCTPYCYVHFKIQTFGTSTCPGLSLTLQTDLSFQTAGLNRPVSMPDAASWILIQWAGCLDAVEILLPYQINFKKGGFYWIKYEWESCRHCKPFMLFIFLLHPIYVLLSLHFHRLQSTTIPCVDENTSALEKLQGSMTDHCDRETSIWEGWNRPWGWSYASLARSKFHFVQWGLLLPKFS